MQCVLSQKSWRCLSSQSFWYFTPHANFSCRRKQTIKTSITTAWAKTGWQMPENIMGGFRVKYYNHPQLANLKTPYWKWLKIIIYMHLADTNPNLHSTHNFAVPVWTTGKNKLYQTQTGYITLDLWSYRNYRNAYKSVKLCITCWPGEARTAPEKPSRWAGSGHHGEAQRIQADVRPSSVSPPWSRLALCRTSGSAETQTVPPAPPRWTKGRKVICQLKRNHQAT